MPLPQDNGPEEVAGDDFSEPPLTPEDTQPVIEEEPAEPTEVDGYSSFDIAEVRPTRFDPVDEEGRTRLVNEEGEPLPEFDQKYREDFYGLAYLGALSKSFEWLGHRFTIRTLTVGEALQVSLLTARYAATVGNGLAYRTAMAAMAVQQIDSKDLPIPVGADPDDFAYAQQRFDYAQARWFQFTIDAIYNEYLVLEQKAREVIDAMGKASGQMASTPG